MYVYRKGGGGVTFKKQTDYTTFISSETKYLASTTVELMFTKSMFVSSASGLTVTYGLAVLWIAACNNT